MPDDKKDEEQEKGFVVKDKRFSAKKEAEGEANGKEGDRVDESTKKDVEQEAPLPEISFVNLIF